MVEEYLSPFIRAKLYKSNKAKMEEEHLSPYIHTELVEDCVLMSQAAYKDPASEARSFITANTSRLKNITRHAKPGCGVHVSAERGRFLIWAVRGTKTLEDWATCNFNVFGSTSDVGAQMGFGMRANRNIDICQSTAKQAGKETIIFTGHSLGAAVAQILLVMHLLTAHGRENDLIVKSQAITFAAPAAFEESTTDLVNGRPYVYRRFTNFEYGQDILGALTGTAGKLLSAGLLGIDPGLSSVVRYVGRFYPVGIHHLLPTHSVSKNSGYFLLRFYFDHMMYAYAAAVSVFLDCITKKSPLISMTRTTGT